MGLMGNEHTCASEECENPVHIDSLGTALFVSIDGIKQYVCSPKCRDAAEGINLPYNDAYHFPIGDGRGVHEDGTLISVPKSKYLGYQSS